MSDKANMARTSCFLEENPKILVITKFKPDPILQVEFETAKEPFPHCPWNVADQKGGMNPNARYTQ